MLCSLRLLCCLQKITALEAVAELEVLQAKQSCVAGHFGQA